MSAPCFIRKNTPELREKLEVMGWELRPSIDRYDCLRVLIGEDQRGCIFKNADSTTMFVVNNIYGDYIDCGENEALFLDLAGMNYGNDRGKLMVLTDIPAYAEDGVKVGDMFRGEYDSYDRSFCRRATPQEIIDYHNQLK